MARSRKADAAKEPALSLGGRILKLRRARGWSTTVLAAKLVERGCLVGQSKITSIETGNNPGVTTATLAALADVLDTTTDYLLGRTDDPTPRR